jgi:hypothetical protein
MTETRGRPSDYDPSYCEKVVEWGSLGKSKTWMAAELDVSRETIYAWERQHPDFSDAITRAMLKSQQWWEDKGQDNVEKPGFNQNLYSRSMAARFPKEWRESKTVEHGIADSLAEFFHRFDGKGSPIVGREDEGPLLEAQSSVPHNGRNGAGNPVQDERCTRGIVLEPSLSESDS